MLSIQINNNIIENELKSKFDNIDDIKKYINNLIIDDFEDNQLLKSMKNNHKKDFVKKDEIFEVLDNI